MSKKRKKRSEKKGAASSEAERLAQLVTTFSHKRKKSRSAANIDDVEDLSQLAKKRKEEKLAKRKARREIQAHGKQETYENSDKLDDVADFGQPDESTVSSIANVVGRADELLTKSSDNTDGVEKETAEETTVLQPLLPPKAKKPLSAAARVAKAAVAAAHELPHWIQYPERFAASVESLQKEGSNTRRNTQDDSQRQIWGGLDNGLITALKKQGVNRLFPVQRAVVPYIVRGYRTPVHLGDVCVSAPTGSGKTLAYVLPIVQCLSTRVVRRIRAVVALPNRDLVGQVRAVFETYINAYGNESGESGDGPNGVAGSEPVVNASKKKLRVLGLSGLTSFAREQQQVCVQIHFNRANISPKMVFCVMPARTLQCFVKLIPTFCVSTCERNAGLSTLCD
eukprot:m.735687 g.735687  ORF g.735687 m.735687 type:complete len:396 (+) comp23092_c0_seq3:208-1395(+)